MLRTDKAAINESINVVITASCLLLLMLTMSACTTMPPVDGHAAYTCPSALIDGTCPNPTLGWALEDQYSSLLRQCALTKDSTNWLGITNKDEEPITAIPDEIANNPSGIANLMNSSVYIHDTDPIGWLLTAIYSTNDIDAAYAEKLDRSSLLFQGDFSSISALSTSQTNFHAVSDCSSEISAALDIKINLLAGDLRTALDNRYSKNSTDSYVFLQGTFDSPISLALSYGNADTLYYAVELWDLYRKYPGTSKFYYIPSVSGVEIVKTHTGKTYDTGSFSGSVSASAAAVGAANTSLNTTLTSSLDTQGFAVTDILFKPGTAMQPVKSPIELVNVINSLNGVVSTVKQSLPAVENQTSQFTETINSLPGRFCGRSWTVSGKADDDNVTTPIRVSIAPIGPEPKPIAGYADRVDCIFTFNIGPWQQDQVSDGMYELSLAMTDNEQLPAGVTPLTIALQSVYVSPYALPKVQPDVSNLSFAYNGGVLSATGYHAILVPQTVRGLESEKLKLEAPGYTGSGTLACTGIPNIPNVTVVTNQSTSGFLYFDLRVPVSANVFDPQSPATALQTCTLDFSIENIPLSDGSDNIVLQQTGYKLQMPRYMAAAPQATPTVPAATPTTPPANAPAATPKPAPTPAPKAVTTTPPVRLPSTT